MIAVTGANGLLGNYILQKFADENIAVVGIKRENSDLSLLSDEVKTKTEWRNADVNDSHSLLEAFKGIDTVIHTAALVTFGLRTKEKIYKTNVEGTRNVVNACLSLGIKRLIFVSSIAALGRKKEQIEVEEDMQWDESDANSDYAKSKHLAELEVYRGQEEGLQISIVNPSMILAPANINNSSAQIFKYILKGQAFYVDGDINYVDARDVAEIIFRLYNQKNSGEKFIANAGHTTLKNMMDEIALRLNKKTPWIKVNPLFMSIGAFFEELRGWLTGAKILLSRQAAKTAREKYIYKNQKSVNQLNIKYRPMSETLDWCCDYYRKVYGR